MPYGQVVCPTGRVLANLEQTHQQSLKPSLHRSKVIIQEVNCFLEQNQHFPVYNLLKMYVLLAMYKINNLKTCNMWLGFYLLL